MIKGVNRQVLEIKDTGCEYFTQALFFVDPKFSTLPEKTLREKAEASLKQKAKSAQNNPKNNKYRGSGRRRCRNMRFYQVVSFFCMTADSPGTRTELPTLSPKSTSLVFCQRGGR